MGVPEFWIIPIVELVGPGFKKKSKQHNLFPTTIRSPGLAVVVVFLEDQTNLDLSRSTNASSAFAKGLSVE